MNRAIRIALALSAASAVLLPRAALAEAPSAKAQPVYVLTLSTEDSDDQADALTQALRSRVRQSQGWSLQETSQSFDTLAIALKCPPKPDSGCLVRIADQLKTDHFMWGTLSKGAAGNVKADVHLWSRGKADVEATNIYSDNLKDPADESLRTIATTLFGNLTGAGAGGTVVVHAGSGAGDVLIDGSPKGTLDGGVARVDVPVGHHSIGVRVPGFDSPAQSTTVAAGADQELTFALVPSNSPPSEGGTRSPFPMRKVLEYGAIVVGGGLLIVSGVETAQWINDSNQSNTDRQNVPANVTDVCTTQINHYAQDACNRSKDAQSVSTVGWVFGGLGAAVLGTGIVLLLTDHSSSSESDGTSAAKVVQKPKLDVLPAVGPQGGSVNLSVTF
jgi:hypothetical protein